MISITAATSAVLETEASDVFAELGSAVSLVIRVDGAVRPAPNLGHEHFGYKDGISQPGVRGLTRPTNPGDPDEGLPGQTLVWPGEFVFGYPAQDAHSPTAPAPAKPLAFGWMENGSYLVFRQLAQLVPEFHAFSLARAGQLGTDPTLLEARLVGRWKSGAPLALTPLQDDVTLAGSAEHNNDFDFSLDPQQRACPYAAHIRKANPRQDFPAVGGGLASVETHRILRAGIPFGPEVSPAEAAAGLTADRDSRGLLFIGYQTSIVDQFEFVQVKWVDNPGFVFAKQRPDGTSLDPAPGPANPFPGPGIDRLIGQSLLEGDRRRFMDEPVPNYPSGSTHSTLQMPADFVVPIGGGYFFAPSITALETTLLV